MEPINEPNITKIKIEQEVQLLVEGRSAQVFITALLRHLDLTNVQIHNYGGINELQAFLRAFINLPGFRRIVKSLGVIRDAETQGFGPAKQSIQDIFKSINLPLLSHEASPRTSIYILPDNSNPGMLETLCLKAVQDDPAIVCIDRYMQCLAEQKLIIKNLDKARIQVFLASRPKFVAHLGEAANKSYLPWDNEAFAGLKKFLQDLSHT